MPNGIRGKCARTADDVIQQSGGKLVMKLNGPLKSPGDHVIGCAFDLLDRHTLAGGSESGGSRSTTT